MKNLTLSGSLVITLLTRIESLLALFILVKDYITGDNNMEHYIQINSTTYWTFQLISAVAIYGLSYYFLSKLQKLQQQLIISNIISNVRARYFFISKYDNIDFYRTPYESEEEFLTRLPDGKFKEYLKQEYKIVRELTMNKLNKTPQQADKILQEYFSKKK